MAFPMGFGPMGGPPDMQMVEGIGPMGFDMDAMKGKGKGMMPMMMPEMPAGPQPPGSWQPWGKRAAPVNMVLPIKYPEKTADAGGDDKDKGQEAGKGKDA